MDVEIQSQTEDDHIRVISMQSAVLPSSTPIINPDGLSLIGCTALILADCMGTGILALPNDIKVVLDDKIGILFVLLNLPINLYAGYILSQAAQFVEDGNTPGKDNDLELVEVSSLDFDYDDDDHSEEDEFVGGFQDQANPQAAQEGENHASKITAQRKSGHVLLDQHEDVSGPVSLPHNTSDFIGLTGTLFGNLSKMKLLVLFVFYMNLFLVLGNYVLVMSHAVRALVGEMYICNFRAGIIASVLMYAFSQLNTMTKLGRTPSYVSLVSLGIVIFLCIHSVDNQIQPAPLEPDVEPSIFRKMAALSSIAFAVGSQKLYLNVRYEMKDRRKAPLALALALIVFGASYITVGQLSGPVPPSFLFDAIPYGSNVRPIAAFFLWIHVAVSYAINSQALCASMERLAFCEIQSVCCCFNRFRSPNAAPPTNRIRWMFLTAVTSASAFLVANAVPFFQDLIALIGAVTSVPLTFVIPAILFRKTRGIPILCRSKTRKNRRRKGCRHRHILSFLLLLFSLAFFVMALLGSISTIEVDWANHAPMFSCY